MAPIKASLARSNVNISLSLSFDNIQNMSAQGCLASNVSPHNIIRRSADFKPNIWGDLFLSFKADHMELDHKSQQRVETYKEEVRKMFDNIGNSSQKLQFIDAVQRLGVSYHFEKEIGEALRKILLQPEDEDDDETDVYNVALKFRLLRQQGHFVSCDVFDKFKDSEGEFKECLITDVRGMLSLYEATHLRVHGEQVLEEALAFTTTHLHSFTSSTSNPSLADMVRHALYQPLHKGLTRLEARRYMPSYEQDVSRIERLLTFAKLDFNQLQKVHQKELSTISRWWEDLDFARKLPFARDRLVECYFWILGVYYEPQYAQARRSLTKVIAMISVVDDIYDVYGTIEELALFTDVVKRWDIAALDELPEYMQVCYAALLDVYKEMEENMALQGKSYRVSYAKRAMTDLVKAYFEEAKWFHQNYVPTMEEYMSVALVTSSHTTLATASFVSMGDIVTKNAFEWLFGNPKMVRASSVVCRLMDDIVSNEFEQKRGHVASAIECYMKQHGATEEVAINELRKQVCDAWKDMNRACLHPTEVPMPLLTRILNLTRVIDVLYKDEDWYTNAGLKDIIVPLLVDSVPL